jgi:glyoxylase-like metal-dependent hydrolase (beta-lactamase superfamily II)
MKLYAVNNGHFKLDGGAMFGVVPKSLWNKVNPADANNMCSWAMRSLLIEDGNRLILIDCGMGDKQSEKFFGFYDLHGDDSLDKGLAAHGFQRNDITDVFLTHLHFDHCGGAIKQQNGILVPAFENARFWSNQRHWQWATQPNQREKASFLKENILPIQESGQLNWVAVPDSHGFVNTPLGFDAMVVDGHTDAQMLPIINYKGQKIAFCADLIPSSGHLPLPWVMGYDTRPLLTLTEKELLLEKAADENILLFFEHDPTVELGKVTRTDRGIRIESTLKIAEL